MTFATSELFTDVRRYSIASIGSSAATNFTQPNAVAIRVGEPDRDAIHVGLVGARRAFVQSRMGSAYASTGNTAIVREPVETVSVFSEFEALRSDDRSIRQQIQSLRKMDKIPYAMKLAARIEDLLDGYKEDMEGRVFSVESLNSLIAFLQSAPGYRYPSITLTRSGDFYLSWKRERSHVFSAQFLKSKRVSFAIFKPHRENVGQNEQFSGTIPAHSLAEIVRQFNVMEWAAA